MHVALGITGCIGAYKGALIIREMQKRGIRDITVIMTRAAQKFITPLTFEALTGRPIVTDLFEEKASHEITHISLARSTDLLLIAPATANIIGKMAAGIADDFLSTFYLATTHPVLIAPAMNSEMWNHAVVQSNIEILKKRNVKVIYPASGYLACGEEGPGRLADPADIVDAIFEILTPIKKLIGKKAVVTAGPTQEPIDSIRFISNRSSGKMGYAMARAAQNLGAEVVLISGPTWLDPPDSIKIQKVETADQMAKSVREEIKDADLLVMAAAVADFKPKSFTKGKLKKEKMPRTIDLDPTQDILHSISDMKGLIRIGFAAECDNLESNALAKLKNKKLDMIIANDVTLPECGFDSDSNAVTVYTSSGETRAIDKMNKDRLAEEIFKIILEYMEKLS